MQSQQAGGTYPSHGRMELPLDLLDEAGLPI